MVRVDSIVTRCIETSIRNNVVRDVPRGYTDAIMASRPGADDYLCAPRTARPTFRVQSRGRDIAGRVRVDRAYLYHVRATVKCCFPIGRDRQHTSRAERARRTLFVATLPPSRNTRPSVT
jgi:hypothetical protein